ncbi:hypothetical protein RDABS01_015582 [Bienertia sinuspersici]
MNNPLSISFSEHRKNNSSDIEMRMGEKLQSKTQQTKTARNAGVVKALRSKMKQDVSHPLKRVKLIKDRLKGRNSKKRWRSLWLYKRRFSEEYKETIQRKYFTEENSNEKTLYLLIRTGESETFLQKAI